jgi:hypothetical protein
VSCEGIWVKSWVGSREQRARAESREERVESREQEQRAESSEQWAESSK